MTNIMAQLEALSNKDWQNLFSAIEEDSRRRVASLKEDLQYIGEIDCPTEMYQDFATVKDVEGKGKTNWFVCSDGSFFTCDDATVDALYDSGRVVDHEFPFEIERMEKYEQLSKDERMIMITCMYLKFQKLMLIVQLRKKRLKHVQGI